VLNEDAYSNLIMSIDTTTSAGKVAFSLVRGTKSADYEHGNTTETAFTRLTNKYAPKTALSLAKTNRLFYQAKLKKQVNPDIFITYLEGLRATMGEMESFITDEQFIIHVITNNLNKDYDYDNTVENLEKLIDVKNDPKTSIKLPLHLRFSKYQVRRKTGQVKRGCRPRIYLFFKKLEHRYSSVKFHAASSHASLVSQF
jgi:hypothetical protein